MPVNKIAEGYKLFKEGKVHPDENSDPNNMRFFVEASKQDGFPKKFYDVINRDGYWTCDCDDWAWRHEKREGAYPCKHIYGSIYKQGEIEKSNFKIHITEESIKETA